MNEQLTERLLYAKSTHWVKYIQKTLLYSLVGLFGLSLIFIAIQLFSAAPILAGAVFLIGFMIFLICHHLVFHLYFSEQLIDILVTSKRIIYFNDCLFTCDDEHEVPLAKIAGVEVQKHGFISNLLNYGILWFDTGGSSVDLKRSIPNVPHPDELSQIINKALREL